MLIYLILLLGFDETVRILIENGANTNAVNNDGFSSLLLAANKGKL